MSKLTGVNLAFLASIFCCLPLIGDCILVWHVAQQWSASSWPTAMGTVTHSAVRIDSDSEGNSYRADVHYQYVVNGQSFTSNSLRLDELSSWQERAESLVQKYEVGQQVVVHYNPAAPQQAVLELGLDTLNYWAALLLVPFHAIGVGAAVALWAEWRSKRLGRPIFGVWLHANSESTTIRLYDRSPVVAALGAFGGASFLAAAGIIVVSWVMPLDYAIALGWSVALAATPIAWLSARKKYVEIRVDRLRDRLTLRDRDGQQFSVARDDFRSVEYSFRPITDSDGDRSFKFPLGLRYHDGECQESRLFPLPEQDSQGDAELMTSWLNGLLHDATADSQRNPQPD